MNKSFALVAAMAALGQPAFAAPNDYAKGVVVQTDAPQPIVRLVVPAVVYETVTTVDLADVAVFDAAGQEVPFAIRRPPDATERWSDAQPLPVFALPEVPAGEPGSKINVQLAGDGTVVAIEGASAQTRSTRFLIDASDHPDRIDQLRLQWTDTGNDFTADASLEASDDLTAWHRVDARATLAMLSSHGKQVVQNEIELPSVNARYLRLTLSHATAPLEIREVTARARQTEPQPRQSRTLAASVLPRDGGTVLEYRTGGRFPVDRIALALPEANQALDVRVFLGRPDAKTLEYVGEHLFYRVDAAGRDGSAPRASAPMSVRSTGPLWHLETDQTITSGASAPGLVIQWLPHEVVFLKQGSGPYTLAFGRADAEPSRWPLSRIQSMLGAGTSLADLPLARTGDTVVLGGAGRLTPVRRLPWQRIALWAVLVLGVVIVGAFAWRLARTSDSAS